MEVSSVSLRLFAVRRMESKLNSPVLSCETLTYRMSDAVSLKEAVPAAVTDRAAARSRMMKTGFLHMVFLHSFLLPKTGVLFAPLKTKSERFTVLLL